MTDSAELDAAPTLNVEPEVAPAPPPPVVADIPAPKVDPQPLNIPAGDVPVEADKDAQIAALHAEITRLTSGQVEPFGHTVAGQYVSDGQMYCECGRALPCPDAAPTE